VSIRPFGQDHCSAGLRVTGVAPSAWEAFGERVARLYEQTAPQEETRRRIELYVRRWKRWVLWGVRQAWVYEGLK
jgi:hypothetical protein